jgi:hypothetical protein
MKLASICVRCRAPATTELSSLRATSGPLSRRHRDEIELCVDCGDDFTRWLRTRELFEALNVGGFTRDVGD